MPISPNPNPQIDSKKTTILNTELKEKKVGLFGRLKAKWNQRVMENKRKALRRKGFSEEEIENELKNQKAPKKEEKKAKENLQQEKKAPLPKLSKKEAAELKRAESIYEHGLTTIKDLIAPSSMEIKFNQLRVSDMYARTFFVYSYPRYIDVNWLSPVVNFDVTMDISMFIYPSDSAVMMKVLRNKVAQITSSIRINQDKGMVRDPGLETALQDAEELRDKLQR